MDQTNTPQKSQEEAPEQFEFELTDEQLEAVAGGADPMEFARRVALSDLKADTNPIAPKKPTARLSRNQFIDRK